MGHLAIVLSWHRDYIPSFVLSVYYTQTSTTTNNRNQSKTNVLLNKYEFCTTRCWNLGWVLGLHKCQLLPTLRIDKQYAGSYAMMMLLAVKGVNYALTAQRREQ